MSNDIRQQVEALLAYWGVDTPPLTRYLGWLGDVVKGDFGTSLLYRRPVLEVVGERLSSSLILLLSAWILSGILGLILGVVAGGVPREASGPADPGILRGDLQYAGILAGDPASSDLFCLAWLVSYRNVCTGRNGIVGGHGLRPALSCGAPA